MLVIYLLYALHKLEIKQDSCDHLTLKDETLKNFRECCIICIQSHTFGQQEIKNMQATWAVGTCFSFDRESLLGEKINRVEFILPAQYI